MRITTKTKLTSVEVIKRAIKFFGPDGYKLVLTGQTETSVAFEGGGGSVNITLCDDNGKTSADFLSREWDYQVKEFIRLIR